jgi:hypothetical protein
MASATQDPDYWPIHIARSDGKGYAGLDHSPLDPNEVKDVDQLERWEVIIAGHLQFQLAPKEESECPPAPFLQPCRAKQLITCAQRGSSSSRPSQRVMN